MTAKEDRQKSYLESINASSRYAREKVWPRYARLRSYWRYSCLPQDAPTEAFDPQLAGGVNQDFVRSAVIMPVVEAQVAGLMPRNPKVRAVPRKEFFQTSRDGVAATISAEKTIPVVEKLSDYDIEQCDLRGQGKRSIRDGRLLGLGAMEVGWDPFFGKVPMVERTIEPDSMGAGVKIKTNLRYQEYIRKAAPYYRYRRAEDVVLPSFVQSANDAPFLILRNRRLLYEVANDPNYEVKDKKELEEKAGIDWMNDDGYTKDQRDDAMRNGLGRMCLEQHVWNRADGIYAVYVDGIQDPVRWGEWPFDVDGVDGFPIKLYIPLPADNDPYGVSPMSYLVAAQQEKNTVRSKMSEMVKKWRNITLYDKNDTDPRNVDAIATAPEGSLVGVDGIRNFLPMPAVMDSLQYLLQYEQRIADDIRIQSNVSDYQLAGTGDANFATDSALQAQAASARREDDMVLVRKFLGDAVKFGFQLRQELQTNEESVKITGDTSEWLKVSPEQIVGEYDFHLEVEDAPSDSARAREEATMLLEGFYGKPEVDGVEVLKRTAKLLRQPTDIVKGIDQFAARREAEYENEMLLNADPAAEMIRPAPQENKQIHIQSHQEAIQRAQAEGRDPTMLMEHLQITVQADEVAQGGTGMGGGGGRMGGQQTKPGVRTGQMEKTGKPLAGGAPGQVKMSGKRGKGNPVERVRRGDVGALRGMAGSGG